MHARLRLRARRAACTLGPLATRFASYTEGRGAALEGDDAGGPPGLHRPGGGGGDVKVFRPANWRLNRMLNSLKF